MNDKAYIEQIIQTYDKVVLLEKSSKDFDWNVLENMSITNPHILILSTKQLNVKEKQIGFKQINKKMEQELCDLYHIYEFADNFILLEKKSTVATIFNYVQTAILTPEEAWNVLLENRNG